jgi:hypothetical protein
MRLGTIYRSIEVDGGKRHQGSHTLPDGSVYTHTGPPIPELHIKFWDGVSGHASFVCVTSEDQIRGLIAECEKALV